MGKKTYTFPLAASPGRPSQISVNDGGSTTSWGDLALPLARWCHTLCLIKSSSWVKVVVLRNKANQDKTEIQVFWSTWCTGPLRKRTIWEAEAAEEGYLLPGGPGGHVRVMLGPPIQSFTSYMQPHPDHEGQTQQGRLPWRDFRRTPKSHDVNL